MIPRLFCTLCDECCLYFFAMRLSKAFRWASTLSGSCTCTYDPRLFRPWRRMCVKRRRDHRKANGNTYLIAAGESPSFLTGSWRNLCECATHDACRTLHSTKVESFRWYFNWIDQANQLQLQITLTQLRPTPQRWIYFHRLMVYRRYNVCRLAGVRQKDRCVGVSYK